MLLPYNYYRNSVCRRSYYMAVVDCVPGFLLVLNVVAHHTFYDICVTLTIYTLIMISFEIMIKIKELVDKTSTSSIFTA